MKARLVVFPIRGRNWCFSRSIEASQSEAQSSSAPSTLKDLWKRISSKSSRDSPGANIEMNNAWTSLEKAPAGSIKNRIHGLGLTLLSRVKPSEIFLKSISKEVTRVDITYPSSLNGQLVRRRLRHIASRGAIIHKKYLYGSAALLPLSSFFMVLPLPNIPFFWVLFRTYSHWRALQGSENLLRLLTNSSHQQQSDKGTTDKSTNVKDDTQRTNNCSSPPWVLLPSEDLQKLIQSGESNDGLSESTISDICQRFNLNTMDMLGSCPGSLHLFPCELYHILESARQILGSASTSLAASFSRNFSKYRSFFAFRFARRTNASEESMAPAATDIEDEIKDEKNPPPLDEDDIALLKTYLGDNDLPLYSSPMKTPGLIDKAQGSNLLPKSQVPQSLLFELRYEGNKLEEGLGPYSTSIKKAEKEIKDMAKKINDLCGIKESDTGLAAPSQWDLVSDKQMMQEEQPLQVARCTKIISPNTEDAKYVINVKQIAKFVVGLGDKVSPTDIEEGMRVGVDRNKYQIQIPLPPKIDPSVTMMTVEEKPDVTYNDVGGCKEQIEKMREVVELPMLHPEKFVKLGIDPPKGVLCYGPPGTGKTLLARAVANRTDACFIRVIGSELVQKYVGEGARMVRELFQMARSKKACIVFFDEVDAIGGARFDDGVGGDNEVQRTMLEIVNQLDGFDARGNIKVLMATNSLITEFFKLGVIHGCCIRPDTLDPALLRPGRLDRKVEFGLPDLESRTQIFKIHTRTMNCERDIRFELLARLCPNSTGADIRSVCTEAGMYAIRARRKTVTEKDFLDAVNKVIKGYQKFSATPKYMVYN
uniref:AAA+ ATPase domain-containing protein n=1 Tax=Solanum lycopersicum TaxID=4081 RepID=A0A3Q7GVY6_SOLLC